MAFPNKKKKSPIKSISGGAVPDVPVRGSSKSSSPSNTRAAGKLMQMGFGGKRK